MPRQGVDPDYVRELWASGYTKREIAQKINRSLSRTYSLISELGLVRPYIDHSDIIPRGVDKRHRARDKEHQYLLILGNLAKTGIWPSAGNQTYRVHSAYEWAKEHAKKGEACYYSPSRGFYCAPESGDWHNLSDLVRSTQKYFEPESHPLADLVAESDEMEEETEVILYTHARGRKHTA